MSDNGAKFAKNSVVDILIPEASSVDIEDTLGTSEAIRDLDDTTLVTSIAQRTLLFFDEQLPLYVVLRTSCHSEELLKSYLSRLSIVLEAHAISSPLHPAHPGDPNHGTASNQPRDVIWSGKVNVAADPIIVVVESDVNNDGQDVLVLWRLIATMTRPRIRLQAPAIIFKLSASLQLSKRGDEVQKFDPYLASGVPLPGNLLQPLQDDPVLRGAAPQLSAARLSRVLPSVHNAHPESLPLKVISRKAIRAIPAISGRMRYHRANSSSTNPAIVAALDVEIPSFAQNHVELESVELRLNNGVCEDMDSSHILKLPMECRPRDNIAFLYRLAPDIGIAGPMGDGPNAKVLDVTINAAVLVSPNCRPQIEMRWKTNVDFSIALNPSFGKPGQSIQRHHRPSSLPPPTTSTTRHNTSTDSANSSAKTSIDGSRSSSSISTDLGVSITFTSSLEVYVGEPFHWDIFIVNRSNKMRRLAIVAIPSFRRTEARKTSSRPSSSSSNSKFKNGAVADAVIDENVLYAAMKSQNTMAAQIVCLTTEIRTGPLNPGSCHATEFKFLPLERGFLHIDSIRVMDMTSSETVDITDLPDIKALDRVFVE